MKHSDTAQFHGGSHHRGATLHRSSHIKSYVRVVKRAIKKLGGPVCLVGTGMSGALLVPEIAHIIGLPFVLLRERGAKPRCHSSDPLIGMLEHRALFVDDLIDMGGTIKRTQKALRAAGSTIVGCVTRSGWDRGRTIKVSKGKEVPWWLV